MPRRRVVRADGLVRGLERAEAEADVAGPDLGVEGTGGAFTDAAVARRSPAVRRHGGAALEAARKRWKRRGGEGIGVWQCGGVRGERRIL